jgi:hypothetical protein
MEPLYSPQSRAERLIAGGRVILAASSLFAVWLDPTEPANYARTAYALLASYVVYALVIAALVWRSDAAGYKPSGPLSSLSLGNGLTETRLFDARYFPDRIQVPGVLDWDYTVDAMGNVTSIADGLTPSASRSFTYQDHQYFLTQATGPWPALAWTYDKIGDRLTETQTGEPLPFTYTYSGTTPKLLQIQPRPHANGSGSVTYILARWNPTL